jgi:hypothetical protein
MIKSKNYLIDGNLSQVVPQLVDLSIYADLHPLIFKAIKKEGVENTYDIHERPFTWLSINIKYSASVTHNESSIKYDVNGLPFPKVVIKYELIEKAELIVEIAFNIQIEGILPGKVFLMNKMFKAQDELMLNLQNKLNTI